MDIEKIIALCTEHETPTSNNPVPGPSPVKRKHDVQDTVDLYDYCAEYEKETNFLRVSYLLHLFFPNTIFMYGCCAWNHASKN